MLCKVSYCHTLKRAVVAENLESLINKGRHIFNDIVCSWLIVLERSICFFRGCQQCLLSSVLRLAIISRFTKVVPFVEQ